MVQVIENRADLEGQVLSVRVDAKRPRHRTVTIAVGAAAPVEGYPNLFAQTVGSSLDVIVPVEKVQALNAGSKVRFRVRRTGPFTVFADHCAPAD